MLLIMKESNKRHAIKVMRKILKEREILKQCIRENVPIPFCISIKFRQPI